MRETLISVLNALLRMIETPAPVEPASPPEEVEGLGTYAVVNKLDEWGLEFELASTIKLNVISPDNVQVQVDSVIMKGRDVESAMFIKQADTEHLQELITKLSESIAIHLVKHSGSSVILFDNKQNNMLN